MEITVRKVTTKLTKSLISQMPFCRSPEVVHNAEVIGLFYNCHKQAKKIMILSYEDKYYLLEADWEDGKSGFYRKWGKWSHCWDFTDSILKDLTWEAYEKLRSLAVHTYI